MPELTPATAPASLVCPHCGGKLPAALDAASTHAQACEREYDRRGVLLPQRTRVGGIIAPQ